MSRASQDTHFSPAKPMKGMTSGKLLPCSPQQESLSFKDQVLTQESEPSPSEVSELPFGPRSLPAFIPSKASSAKVPSLKDFSIQEEIGRGAFAKVRLAYLPERRAYFAAKIYEKTSIEDPARYESLQTEIKILRQMDHPNIVKLEYVLESPTQVFLMFEHIRGVPLNIHLRRFPDRKCSEEQARAIFRGVMSAVVYCHSLSICHRDIKLENVIVDDYGHAKLIDFGLSTCFDKGLKVRMFCGTLNYMAPEIVQKVEYSGCLADIWACAVLLYALVTGSFPFKAVFDKEIMHRIYVGHFYLPGEFSSQLRALILQMMHKTPENRLTAQQVLEDEWMNLADNNYTSAALECRFKRVRVKGQNLFEKICITESVN